MKSTALALAAGGVLSLSSEAQAADINGYEFSGSVSGGYDSMYNFRGFDFGENAPWGGIDLELPISDPLSLNTGVWYINPTDDPSASFDDELDLYAFLNFPIGPVSVGVGGTYFMYPETTSTTAEFGFNLGYSLQDWVDLGFAYYYDIKAKDWDDRDGGSYLEFTVGKTFALSESVSLEALTGVAYGIDYYGVDSLQRWFASLGLPVAISETLTFTPYIATSIALEDMNDLESEGDHVYGGASVSVAF